MMNSRCLVTIFELKKSIKPIENIEIYQPIIL